MKFPPALETGTSSVEYHIPSHPPNATIAKSFSHKCEDKPNKWKQGHKFTEKTPNAVMLRRRLLSRYFNGKFPNWKNAARNFIDFTKNSNFNHHVLKCKLKVNPPRNSVKRGNDEISSEINFDWFPIAIFCSSLFLGRVHPKTQNQFNWISTN